jgi:hypothetical protein
MENAPSEDLTVKFTVKEIFILLLLPVILHTPEK